MSNISKCEGELYNQLRSDILRMSKEYKITYVQILGVLDLLKRSTVDAGIAELKNESHYQDEDET